MNDLIDSNAWLVPDRLDTRAKARLLLFDHDVRSAQLSYRDFAAAWARFTGGQASPADSPRSVSGSDAHDVAKAEVYHYAKAFVCAIQRVTALAQDLSANSSVFGAAVADKIEQAWQQKRAFFRSYTEYRDAIEHIDSRVNSPRTEPVWLLMKVTQESLTILGAQGHAVISADAIGEVLSFRAEILAAIAAAVTE